jgi:hypothetical protein
MTKQTFNSRLRLAHAHRTPALPTKSPFRVTARDLTWAAVGPASLFVAAVHHLAKGRTAPAPDEGAGALASQGRADRVGRLIEALVTSRR